ncbi:unnamed protein product [Rhizoctonia solani]|uniref:Uncharacterized protein n=2 Tax=Rhizoctonia solani TaxID=456999 RepID=A0A8H3DXR2_9AGAM|nr:unnamed protein product [Rhizoctonia solani]
MNDFQLTFQLSQGKAKPSRPTSGISDSVWVILDLCWSRSPEARPSLPTIAEHLSSHSLSHGYDPRLPDFDQASELGIAEVLNGGTSLPSSTPPSYQPGAHSFNTGRSTPHVSLEPTPSLNRSHTPNPPPNGESSDHLLVPVPVRSNHHFSPRESVTPPTDISRPPVEPSYSLEEEAISHASTSLNIDVVPSRTMSSLAIVTDGASTDAQGDGESQDVTYRTDSPTSMFHEDSSSGSLGVNGQSEKRKLSDLGRGNEEPIPEHAPLSVNTRSSPPIIVNPPSAVPTIQDSSSSTADAEHTRHTPNAKFKALTKRVIHTFRVGPQYQAPSSLPVRSILSSSVMSDSRHRQDSSEHDLTPTDIQTYVPILRTLRSSQLLTEHVALVKHLQFSPGGQFLATCSWDRTALIWRVGAGPQGEFELMHKLVHTTWVGGFIGQVDWSPDGEQLLTKQLKSIKVWSSKNGVCERTIDRKRIVQAITWMPKGSRFLSIEWKMGSSQAEKRVHHTENILGSDLVVVGTDGVLHQAHHLPRLQVWDAAVTPNEKRLVAVATLHRSEQDHRTAKSRSEKRILIYNLRTQEIENQVSLSHEVRDVTLTEEGNFALVSYENKAPPQAWFLEKVLREGKQRLVLAHTYSTQNPVDFAGPSYFGGLRDTLVLAASKSGEIYIWERWSGLLLHSLKAPDQEASDTLLESYKPCLEPQDTKRVHVCICNARWNG